jgi:glycosyltransferase involved in cell wall biosynthesis
VDAPLDVSVIIPCFNDGTTVREAVASAKTERPREIIVVDDGSTDSQTLSVLDDLAAGGVTVLHQSNQGPAAARTHGLRHASSRLVFNLDADDLLVPGALVRMVSALDADQRLSLAWGDHERFGTVGYRYDPKAPSLDPWRITFVNEIGMSALIRRADIDAVGGWGSGDLYEDWDLWMVMADRGHRGTNIGSAAIRYRVVAEPRRFRTATREHRAIIQRMRRRHGDLFAARRDNRRRSATGRPLKVAWTVIDAVPLPGTAKRYILYAALITLDRGMRPRGPRGPHRHASAALADDRDVPHDAPRQAGTGRSHPRGRSGP